MLNCTPSFELFCNKTIKEIKRILNLKEKIKMLELKDEDICFLSDKLEKQVEFSLVDILLCFYGNKKSFNERIAKNKID